MDKITIKHPAMLESQNGKEIVFSVNGLDQVSDGYHTIAELYDHRITLYIALCRLAHAVVGQRIEHIYDVWRSKKHSDGKDSYDGWFIMGIGKEKGKQISYHIPLSRWDETDFAETLEIAPEWDGHTSDDVLERLKML